jgi:hypothetical protein
VEATNTSETMVNFYQTTRRYNPEQSYIDTRRRENLKSYFFHLIIVLQNMSVVTPECAYLTSEMYVPTYQNKMQ